ncbi:MAG TPA: glutathione binding-like protein [Stellaceae bacterium]
MIELYTFGTPNGRKAAIMVEEVGIPYELHLVDLFKGEHKSPAFLAINPNGKIPAIVDRDGPGGKPLPVFESGAILMYLAEKTGKLLPAGPRGRISAIEWLMFQMGGVGPFFGQAEHFAYFAKERVPYAIDRYVKETERLLAVMEHRLGETEYLAGGEYSIADIATFPWVSSVARIGMTLDGRPNLRRWRDAIAARPAVQRALERVATPPAPPSPIFANRPGGGGSAAGKS